MKDNLLSKRLRKNWGKRCNIYTLTKKFTFESAIILENDEKYLVFKDTIKDRTRIISIDDIEGLEILEEDEE